MTLTEYATYEKAFAVFMEREQIDILGEAESDGEGYFSWRPCDCCSSPLGGTRFEMIGASAGVGPNGNMYEVCLNCYYYSVYGRLCDMAMMELTED